MHKTLQTTARGLRTFGSDVVDGFFEITHNGFALLGLATVFAVLALFARPDLRASGEAQLATWLESRKPAPEAPEAYPPNGLSRTSSARIQPSKRPS